MIRTALKRLRDRLVGTAPVDKEPETPAAVATAPSGLEDGIAHNRAQLEKMREHLRTYGSAVGALATAVLAGVGWATLKDIAPVPEGREWLIAVAGVAALAALAGSVLLVGLFFAAQRRIVFDTDTIPDARVPWTPADKAEARRNDLTHEEARAARAPLDDLADEELAADVAAVERRQYRLARTARRYAGLSATLAEGTPERARAAARAELLQAEADRLADAHRAAAVQATVSVLETRQRQVFNGRRARTLSLVVVLGIVGLFVVADYSRGARALDATQLACADKLAALAAADLVGYSCDARGRLVPPAAASDGGGQSDAEDPTADVALLARLAACENAVTRPASTADPVEGWEDRAAVAVSLCAGLPLPTADDAAADAAEGGSGKG